MNCNDDDLLSQRDATSSPSSDPAGKGPTDLIDLRDLIPIPSSNSTSEGPTRELLHDGEGTISEETAVNETPSDNGTTTVAESEMAAELASLREEVARAQKAIEELEEDTKVLRERMRIYNLLDQVQRDSENTTDIGNCMGEFLFTLAILVLEREVWGMSTESDESERFR